MVKVELLMMRGALLPVSGGKAEGGSEGGSQGCVLPDLLVDDVERGVEEELVLLVHRRLLLLRDAHPAFRGERIVPPVATRDVPMRRTRDQ